MGVSGLLLLDKDSGWTSQDCVSKLRGILGERRIGHSGTLDPMATGLLVILVGRATRAASYAEAGEKEYLARFRPGLSTDTQDITGTPLFRGASLPSEEAVLAALPRFTGEIRQIPPMYSAVKIHGRKLYEAARRGETVEREPRTVTIHSLDFLGRDGDDYLLRVRCSRGTYVRTLCHDLGEALGCGGCLSALRRTASGSFRVEDARRIDAVTREDRERLLPVDRLFPDLPAYTLSEAQERRCRCGNPFSFPVPDGRCRLYAQDGSFLAVGSAENGVMKNEKSFFETD